MQPNQVYGVSDLHSQEKEVRIEDKLYDVAESNKHQVSLSHDKIKMKPNIVYGVGQSSDGPEVSQHKKGYVNINMEMNTPR